MIGSLPDNGRQTVLEIAFCIISQLSAQLTIDLINPFSRHWFDQKISQCPNQRIHPIRRTTGRMQKVSTGVRRKCTHLILKFREHAQVVHTALFVERRNRFRTRHLPAGSADRSKWRVWLYHPQRRFDHVAAIVHLRNDPVGLVGAIDRNGRFRPLRRLVATRGIGEYPTPSTFVLAGNDNACLVSPVSRARGRIDGDHYSDQRRGRVGSLSFQDAAVP